MEISDSSVDLYQSEVEGLERFGQMLTELVSEILRNHGIIVHAVTYRVKSEESALLKLERKPDRYDGIGSLTDLLGLRVICYFSDQVDDVASALQAQFDIDEENSEDKRKALGDREFGYLSLHRIAKVLPHRGTLIEYQRFKDERFEIQIRSILQHAWAEIEHDLGYKVETIPSHLRRRFSMLAGVLELADREFISLRSDVTKYEKDSEKQASIDPDNLALDQSTLEAVLVKDPLFIKLDEGIAEAGGSKVASDVLSKNLMRRLADLTTLGIHDMRQLRQLVTQRQEYIWAYAKYRLEAKPASRRGPAPRGVGLMYLILMIKAQHLLSGEEDPMPRLIVGDQDEFLQPWRRVIAELGPFPAPL